MTHIIPVGTSEPQDFRLEDNGTPIDGTGSTVELDIKLYAGGVTTVVASPPTVDWLSAAGGTVRVPDADGLAVGHYLVRFKLTDSGGNVGFVPNAAKADVWRVVAVAAT